MFDYIQSQEYSGFHPFVQKFFEHEDIFVNHEIEYIKNNCENYPKYLGKYGETSVQELMEDIKSYHKETEKQREIEKVKWEWSGTRGGMFEEPNKGGMFEFEEELDRIDQFDE